MPPASPHTALTRRPIRTSPGSRSEEHTSELQSRLHLVCRLLLEKKNNSHELINVHVVRRNHAPRRGNSAHRLLEIHLLAANLLKHSPSLGSVTTVNQACVILPER